MSISESSRMVYLEVDRQILHAAKVRAKVQGQNFSAICRAIVNKAAGDELPEYRVVMDKRVERVDVARVKFTVNRAHYAMAKKRFEWAGRSIGMILEVGLERYALSGNVTQ